MRSVKARYVLASIAIGLLLLLLLSYLLSLALAVLVVVFVVGSVFAIPLWAHAADFKRKQNYIHWRHGRLPQRTRGSRKRKQLSLRGLLLFTTAFALFISYLQHNSPTSGFVLGAGCVLTGILLGLDYDPRGAGILRGKQLSATIGGALGAFAFAMLLIGVQFATSWPHELFRQSLGRLTLLWLCVGTFTGAAMGTWVAARPFRKPPTRNPLDEDAISLDKSRSRSTYSTTAPSITPRDESQNARLIQLLPAILASVLFHLAFISLQAGLFDIGAQLNPQQSSAQDASNEIRIVATLSEPKDELDEASELVAQFEMQKDLATEANETKRKTANRPSPAINKEEQEKVETALDSSGNPSPRETLSGQGTYGTSASESFEVPLNGQTVRVVSQIGSYTFRDVHKLRLLSDGTRIKVNVDTSGAFTGVELPLNYMSVEFQSSDSSNEQLLATKPFVNVRPSIEQRSPLDGEAKIEILDPQDIANYVAAPPVAQVRIAPMGSVASQQESAHPHSLKKTDRQTPASEILNGAGAIQSQTRGTFLDGRCPVTLIDLSKWTRGDKRFQVVQNGWIVRFSSAAAMKQFKLDTKKYMPVFNGYDIVAANEQQKLIMGNRRFGMLYQPGPKRSRIYLFSTAANRNKFEADPDAFLSPGPRKPLHAAAFGQVGNSLQKP